MKKSIYYQGPKKLNTSTTPVISVIKVILPLLSTNLITRNEDILDFNNLVNKSYISIQKPQYNLNKDRLSILGRSTYGPQKLHRKK